VQTETSVLTAVFGLFAVQSGLFDFWDKGRLVTVTVMVKALGGQKTGPDWTFKHYLKDFYATCKGMTRGWAPSMHECLGDPKKKARGLSPKTHLGDPKRKG